MLQSLLDDLDLYTHSQPQLSTVFVRIELGRENHVFSLEGWDKHVLYDMPLSINGQRWRNSVLEPSCPSCVLSQAIWLASGENKMLNRHCSYTTWFLANIPEMSIIALEKEFHYYLCLWRAVVDHVLYADYPMLDYISA